MHGHTNVKSYVYSIVDIMEDYAARNGWHNTEKKNPSITHREEEEISANPERDWELGPW
jgi:hypothetical protein